MSMYTVIIKEQEKTIDALEKAITHYHELTHELIDVLAQHINVSEYEKRLAELDGEGGKGCP